MNIQDNTTKKTISYPIVVRIVDGFIEISQPDLGIYIVKGKFAEVRTRLELGTIILDTYQDIINRIDSGQVSPPSQPKQVVKAQGKYVTISEASKLMGTGIAVIRRMCDSGCLDSFLTSGGHRRVLVNEKNERFLKCLSR